MWKPVNSSGLEWLITKIEYVEPYYETFTYNLAEEEEEEGVVTEFRENKNL